MKKCFKAGTDAMSESGKPPIDVIYSRIINNPVKRFNRFHGLKQLTLPIVYWIISHYWHTPGLFFHRYIVQLALKLWFKGGCDTTCYRQMISFPMDSVRYFEFDFMWESLKQMKRVGNYLDISSPRMFPLILLDRFPQLAATVVNPDAKDLNVTRQLFDSCSVSTRSNFYCNLIDDVNLIHESFDVITCISVIEHISDHGDQRAVAKMWDLLKPGGKLLLSVPCAKTACEEYVDFDEYGLLDRDADNFVFGQRFYDESLLTERIFNIIGEPHNMRFYGEKQRGFSTRNREDKVNNVNYPFWREPYMMAKNFDFFDSINDLPGWGVVAMEFHKTN